MSHASCALPRIGIKASDVKSRGNLWGDGHADR